MGTVAVSPTWPLMPARTRKRPAAPRPYRDQHQLTERYSPKAGRAAPRWAYPDVAGP